MYKGKTVLVTGGTGSFGHYIVKELMRKDPAEIRIFSRDEKKQDDMRYKYRHMDNLRFIIGDVRNSESLMNAVRGSDMIFHAAALKQVPSCEYNVHEAVLTNIIGGKNVIDCAIEENVEKVIAVSTDKAVKPVNTMGMTKALQEKLMIWANLNKNGCRTVFAAVRYGNVVGSRGSVVPLFKKQIEEGGPLTITDPEMTRFILTLEQAVKLVFKAAEEAVGGEIFVMKIPSVKIGNLADVMLSSVPESLRPDVKISGIRPGEKIDEVLVSEEEAFRTIDMGDYYCILPAVDIPVVRERYRDVPFVNITEYTSGNTERYSDENMVRLLDSEGWMPTVRSIMVKRGLSEDDTSLRSINRNRIIREMETL
ncbi:MAG: NAD-dependent epimerase/dehydratase family protein [candidate division Zixibacteria bacterium]|nr:NAD-dependent epimerase/dehydratase family protein [candidate division Zixibacteria bacterium]